tara:strand:+ start:426 stop:1307 length:882 start_codon:yes stop_codon:yes gene_type:complete
VVRRVQVYRNFSQEELDREYDNLEKVANADKIIETWKKKGEQVSSLLSCQLNIRYGQHDRQALDIFPANSAGGPVLAFIHGGYWCRQDKSIARFLAPLYVAAEINFVCVGYRLCPEVAIGDVVADIRSALGWLYKNAKKFGGNGNKLYVAGHSAGGHLAAVMCGPLGPGPEYLKGGCSISGLHDLEPIRLSFLNSSLSLSQEEARRLSPIWLSQERGADDIEYPPLIIAVGSTEGSEYMRQSNQLESALRKAGQPTNSLKIENGNHFSACEAFADPSSSLSDAMLRLIFSPRF